MDERIRGPGADWHQEIRPGPHMIGRRREVVNLPGNSKERGNEI